MGSMAPLARRGPGIRSLTSSSARAVPSRRSGLVMKDRSSNLVASSGKQVVVGGEVVYTTMDDEDVLASSGGDAIGGGGVFASNVTRIVEHGSPEDAAFDEASVSRVCAEHEHEGDESASDAEGQRVDGLDWPSKQARGDGDGDGQQARHEDAFEDG